jgi:photosystem II stability/assembly factor-like uncharacterized protein
VSILGRKRLVPAASVAAFVAAFAAIGAVSKANKAAVPAQPLPPVTWFWTMAVAPSDPDAIVVATAGGLYRSGDAGRTWHPTGPKRFNATSLVQAGSSIVAGGVVAPPVGLPVVRKGAARTAPDGPALLAASSDGGATWRALHPRGLPDAAVQALAAGPAGDHALYALLTNGRLYRSSDGGGSFRLVSPQLGVPPWALANPDGGRYLAGDMDTGAYISADGRSWQRTPFTDSRGTRMVMEYAVRPSDAQRVLMTSYGVEMSTDGGRTWHVTLKSDVMFGPVAWAPAAPDIAYAVGFDRSLWRSGDGGKSWAKVSGAAGP